MKHIVIVTYGNFPNGEAASVRMYALSRMFMENDCRVSIISMTKDTPNVWKDYCGVKYISIRSAGNGMPGRVKNVLLFRRRTAKVLAQINDIDILMPLSLPLPALMFCERFAKKRHIRLLTDRTEWYSPKEFALGRLSPQYLQNILTNQCVIDKYWRVISISRCLEDYYRGKGIRTVRIPAVMDVSDIPRNLDQPNAPIRVVYAGSPAKKDSLSLIVKAFADFAKESTDVVLHIYGISREKYEKKYGSIGSDCPTVEFHGRVPREEVLQALIRTDFSTLFRDPEQRFAIAGFPSKVAESMAAGTPVITNRTSDLSLYLRDGENAVLVDSYSSDAYCDALRKILSADRETLSKMHGEARKTAMEVFDYSAYTDTIRTLLDD